MYLWKTYAKADDAWKLNVSNVPRKINGEYGVIYLYEQNLSNIAHVLKKSINY